MKEQSLEDRVLYLNALALVMNADGQIKDSEEKYLNILIKSFDLDKSYFNEFVNFAHAPKKDKVLSFFRSFRGKSLAQLFLIDSCFMAMSDGFLHEKETAVINEIANALEVLVGVRTDIFNLCCQVYNKDWAGSSLYFNSHFLKKNHLIHLLDYHGYDYKVFILKNKFLNSIRLKELMKDKLSYPVWGDKGMDCSMCYLSYGAAIPFLQAMLDRGVVNVCENKVVKIHEGGQKSSGYLDLELCNVFFEKYSRDFSISLNQETQPLPERHCHNLIEDYYKEAGLKNNHRHGVEQLETRNPLRWGAV